MYCASTAAVLLIYSTLQALKPSTRVLGSDFAVVQPDMAYRVAAVVGPVSIT